MSSLHILDINPLLDTSFVNILSHTVGCPSAFWWSEIYFLYRYKKKYMVDIGIIEEMP